MRKHLSKIIVCLLLCVFSVTMFACGKKPEKVDAYEGLTQFIEKVEQDNKTNGMFTASLVNGVASDYVLTEYLNDGTYGYYNQSMIIPMNFIKKYYQDLERISALEDISNEKKAVINDLETSIPELNNAYIDSVEKYVSLKAVSSATVVAEGARQRYVQSLKSFLKISYEVALKLAKVKDVVFNDYSSLKETTAVVTNEQAIMLRDYLMLNHANDFYNCLIVNLEMEDFASISGSKEVQSFVSFIRNVKSKFTSSMALQAIKAEELADLTGEAVTEQVGEEIKVVKYNNTTIVKIFDAFNALENERKMLSKAMEEFSLYDYYVNYSCNMDAYTAKVQYATNYSNEITKFYNNYSNDYVSYLINIFKTGV